MTGGFVVFSFVFVTLIGLSDFDLRCFQLTGFDRVTDLRVATFAFSGVASWNLTFEIVDTEFNVENRTVMGIETAFRVL